MRSHTEKARALRGRLGTAGRATALPRCGRQTAQATIQYTAAPMASHFSA